MSINPYQQPETADETPGRPAGTMTHWILASLAVVGGLALLVSLLLPAVRMAPGAARRTQCSHNLRQIAAALFAYEAKYRALPPAYTTDASGKPLHSWRTLLLPFLDHKDLYESIDLAKRWDDPVNREAYETEVHAYRCPAVDLPSGHTAYLAVVAPDACFSATQLRKLADVTDSPDLTLLVVEMNAKGGVHWMAPTDADEQAIQDLVASGTLSHAGVVYVSGRVGWLSPRLKPAEIRALISIEGKDDAVAQEAMKRLH